MAVPTVRPVTTGFASDPVAAPVALAAARVEEQLRALIRDGQIDPVADRSRVTALVAELVADDQELAAASDNPAEMSHAVRTLLERRLVEAVSGFGPLQPYLDDPTVEEIWINEPGRVFVARRGVSELTTTILGDEQVRDLVERMLMSSGRRLDLSQPFVDASLTDGSRLHVVIPDMTSG